MELVVVGSGRGVWDDVAKALPRIRSGAHVMTVNIMTVIWPHRLDHCYSNHADLLKHWARGRDCLHIQEWGFPKQHTGNPDCHEATHWDLPMHGTSGLNAVLCGLKMGYEQIVICGIPLDDEGHCYDPPDKRDTNFTRQVPMRNNGLKYWKQYAEQVFEGRVKSYSGRTSELLGTP